MARNRFKFELRGHKQLIRRLENFTKPSTVKRILKKSMGASGQEIVRAVRKRVPKDSGLTKKSIAKKTTYRPERGRANTIIGVKKGPKGPPKKPGGREHWPWNIDHLLENGFTAPDGSQVPGHHFLENGQREGAPQAEATYRKKLAAEIEREAKKGGR